MAVNTWWSFTLKWVGDLCWVQSEGCCELNLFEDLALVLGAVLKNLEFECRG